MKHKTYEECSKIPVKLEMVTELHVKRKEGTYVFLRVARRIFLTDNRSGSYFTIYTENLVVMIHGRKEGDRWVEHTRTS